MNRIDTLEPDFKAKIEELLLQVQAVTGLKWVITCARRTMAEQSALYAQGRTAPGKVVTNAKAGESAHNFGMAADFVPINPKTGEPWWDCPRGTWQILAVAAQEMGLVAGFFFKSIFDAPHVEAPNWKEQQTLWREGKIKID